MADRCSNFFAICGPIGYIRTVATVQLSRFSLPLLLLLLFPLPVAAGWITDAEQLAASGAAFSWSDAEAKTVKIFVEVRQPDGNWKRASLGSGFLISPDGLFLTAYHVMKFCLAQNKAADGLAVRLDCALGAGARYKALAAGREFDIEVVSHLSEMESTRGKDAHTPDEIIKQRDFVVGRLKGAAPARFNYWRARDFDESAIDLKQPGADFHLTPLMPPRRVFIVGFPKGRDCVISEGFLNLTEKHRRGYFAANYKVYAAGYLESQGIAADTRWGISVANHMSGGPVVDAAGYVVGMVVNGNQENAAVISIENVLSTFFSRNRGAQEKPALRLAPSQTPLYLRRGDTPPSDGSAQAG